MKKLCGEHVGSVAVLAQCKAAVRERRERTRREPRGGDLEDPLLIAPRRAKWPLAIQLEALFKNNGAMYHWTVSLSSS